MKNLNILWDELGGLVKKLVRQRSDKIKVLWLQKFEPRLSFTDRWLFNSVRLYLMREQLWRRFGHFRKQFLKKSQRIAFSASVVALFNWEKERIDFESVKGELNEFRVVERLKRRTVCLICAKKIQIGNVKLAGVEYCRCSRKFEELTDEEGWEPYIENKGMITWRREEKPGKFAYKVYVEYPDISVEDFLFVQTDIEYRRKWDETAVELMVVDSDQQSNGQIIYWEMLWPKLFNNRDYVYNRSHFVDPDTKSAIIVCRGTSHPKCPPYSNKQRVREYWSNMVVKPKHEFNKPGLEFVLTYFDDPGLSIPRSITTWVAQRQMPEFIEKLHQATLSYAKERKLKEQKRRNIWRRDPGFEYPNFDNEEIDKGSTLWTGIFKYLHFSLKRN